MTTYEVQCAHAAYYTNTVTIDADSLEEALDIAITKANDDPGWRSGDVGETFINAVANSDDPEPSDAYSLPIPGRFTETGEPPLVTVTPTSGGSQISVTEGQIRLQFHDQELATLTTRISDPAPDAEAPVVTVTHRGSEPPHVDLIGGRTRILVRREHEDQPLASDRPKTPSHNPGEAS